MSCVTDLRDKFEVESVTESVWVGEGAVGSQIGDDATDDVSDEYTPVVAAAYTPPVAAIDPRIADAARRDDIEAVRALIAGGADVNAAHGDGMTGLHWAAPERERGDGAVAA